MLVSGQVVIKKWNKQNKDWYESRGYIFTRFGDEFEVKAEDLSKGAKDKVDIQCDYCGEINPTIWRDYYTRKDYGKYACTKCRLKKASESTLEVRREDLYNRAKAFCNECGYTLLTPKEEIFSADSRVDYLCPKHGEHNTKIYTLITGHKCIDCMHEICGDNLKLDIDFMNDYFESHGSKWLNPEDYTKSTDKNLWVTCSDCGEQFLTSFYSFRKHDGQRCPECTNLESQGEYEVRKYLESKNICFDPQHRFHDCRTSVPPSI